MESTQSYDLGSVNCCITVLLVNFMQFSIHISSVMHFFALSNALITKDAIYLVLTRMRYCKFLNSLRDVSSNTLQPGKCGIKDLLDLFHFFLFRSFMFMLSEFTWAYETRISEWILKLICRPGRRIK